MFVLVVDADRHFLELLRAFLEAEGHGVQLTATGAQGLLLLRSRLPDLLLVDADLPHGEGPALVRELRTMAAGERTRVFLMTAGRPGADPALAALRRECAIDAVLRKPFPMFDLLDRFRELLQADEDTGDAGTPASMSGFLRGSGNPANGGEPGLSEVTAARDNSYLSLPVDTRNLRRLAGLWARRASGVLHLRSGPGGAHGWMRLGEGGPLDSAGWELLSAALHGGLLEFDPASSLGAGDQIGLGAMLFGRAREPDGTDFLRRNGFTWLDARRYRTTILQLPLNETTRLLLEGDEPSQLLGEMPAVLGPGREEVAADLAALHAMDLLSLREPQPRAAAVPTRSSSPLLPRPPRRGGMPVVSEEEEITQPSVFPRETPSTSPRGDQRAPLRHPPPGTPPPAPTAPPEEASVRTRARSSIPTMRGRSQDRQFELDRQVERLRKEVGRLRHQSPAVILGVPGSADAALVNEAAARMKARYRTMSDDAELPEEGRGFARQILAFVEKAHADADRRALTSGSGIGLPEEERLLVAAQNMVRTGAFSAALPLLRRARDLRIDHPRILALLGWATMHDSEMPESERLEEAQGLLELAVQFDGACADARCYWALYLEDRGDHDAAFEQASRALQIEPGHAEAQVVLNRLKTRLSSS